jgi:hypothetical protein
MDETSGTLVELGQSLLDQSFHDLEALAGGSDVSDPVFSDALYLDTVRLSTLLKTLHIQSTDSAIIARPDRQRIMRSVQTILNDLASIDKSPSPDIGAGSAYFEAYRVIAFSLLAMQNTAASTTRRPSNEASFPGVRPSSPLLSDNDDVSELLTYLRTEFELNQRAPRSILHELKRKRDWTPSSSPEKTSDLTAELAKLKRDTSDLDNDRLQKIKSLSKKVKSLQESTRSKDVQIENLQTSLSSATVTAQNQCRAALDAKDQEIRKLQKAFDGACAELDKMKAALDAEAAAKRDLLTLVRTPPRSPPPARSPTYQSSPDHSELVSVLKSSLPEFRSLLDDSKLATSSKVLQIVDTVKSQKEAAVKQSAAECARLREQTARVTACLSSVSRFLADAIGGRETLRGLSDSPDDLKSQLVGQHQQLSQFLSDNDLRVDCGDLCDGFSQIPAFVARNATDTTDARDMAALLQISALANDVLRRHSGQLLATNAALIRDVRRARAAAREAEDGAQERAEQAAASAAQLLEGEKAKRSLAERVIGRVHQHLRRSGDAGPVVERALKILAGQVGEGDDDRAFDELIGRLREKDAEREAALAENGKLATLIRRKDAALEAEKAEKCRLEERIVVLAEEVAGLKKAAAEAERGRAQLSESAAKLRQTIDEQRALIAVTNADAQARIDELTEGARRDRKERKAQQKAAEAAHESETQQLTTERVAMAERFAQMKTKCAARLRQAEERQAALDAENGELRARLGESRAAEGRMRGELGESQTAARDLGSQLSASRIDAKMLQLKLSAAEERAKREQDLAETRSSMKVIDLETALQAALETQQIEAEQRLKEFLTLVVEKCRGHVEFSDSVSEESAGYLVDQVLIALRRAEENVQKRGEEMDRVRATLGIGRDVEVEPAVGRLVREAGQKRDTSGEDWEQWARRIHATVADELLPAGKPLNELRNAIEEAVLAGSGQREIQRRLEMLRAEKRLLVRGKVDLAAGGGRRPETLNAVRIAVASVYRMQKLSGCLPLAVTE